MPPKKSKKQSSALKLPNVPKGDSPEVKAKKKKPVKRFDEKAVKNRLKRLGGGSNRLQRLKALHNQIRDLTDKFEEEINKQ